MGNHDSYSDIFGFRILFEVVSWRGKLSAIRDRPLTCESGLYENALT